MTYDQMQSIVELYLLEVQRDGIDPCGFPPHQARELLLDFAQWFCDDVEDSLSTDLETQEISMQDDGTMIFAPDDVDPHIALAAQMFVDGLKPGEIVAIQRNEEESEDE